MNTEQYSEADLLNMLVASCSGPVPRNALHCAMRLLAAVTAERDALLAGRERLERWLVQVEGMGDREATEMRWPNGWRVRLVDCGIAAYGFGDTLDAAITAALDAAEADR